MSTSPKSPKSPFHDRGHYWNRRQVSAENVDKSVSVARKLWGTEEGEKPDKAADGKEAGTATVALWKPYYLENFKVGYVNTLYHVNFRRCILLLFWDIVSRLIE